MRLPNAPSLRSWLAAALMAAAYLAYLLTPIHMLAQSQPYGPDVDICSSGMVDPGGVEETVCLSGDYNNLEGYAEVSNWTEEYGTDSFVPAVGADVQIYDGSTLVSDSGNQLNNNDVQTWVSPPTLGDTYNLWGYADECYDPSGEDDYENCYWEYDTGYETTSAVVTGPPGVAYPLYQVTSILYDAPGDHSSNGFTNSTTDGTTTSIGDSFSQGSTTTYTSSANFLGFGDTLGISFGSSQTTGDSTSFTETVAQAETVTNASAGGVNTMNHGNDLFLVWLNPAISIMPVGPEMETYGVGTQSESSGASEPVDHVEVYANAMEGNGSQSTVAVGLLTPQYDSLTGQQDLPGLAAICANPVYYPTNCSMQNQCGCTSQDFAGILARDPVLNYGPTANPMNANTSSQEECGMNSDGSLTTPSVGANCRYLPVPTTQGSDVQLAEPLLGPSCQSGCNMPVNSGTFSDSSMTTQTQSESQSYTVGNSWKVSLPIGPSWMDMSTLTWTDSESSGAINGYANTTSYSFASDTVDCVQTISIFYDAEYHTFVFEEAPNNDSCP